MSSETVLSCFLELIYDFLQCEFVHIQRYQSTHLYVNLSQQMTFGCFIVFILLGNIAGFTLNESKMEKILGLMSNQHNIFKFFNSFTLL